MLAYLVNSKIPDTISEDTINNDPNLLDIALNAAKNSLGVPMIVSANAIQDDLTGPRDFLTYFAVFRDKSSKVEITDKLSDLISDTSDDSIFKENNNNNSNVELEELREKLRQLEESKNNEQSNLQNMLNSMTDQLLQEKKMRENAERERLNLMDENNRLGQKLIDKAGELQVVTKELVNEKKKVVTLEPSKSPRKEVYKLQMAPLPKLKYKKIENKTPPVCSLDPLQQLYSPDDELMHFYREKLKKYGPVRLQTYVEPTDWESGTHLAQIVHLVDPNLINVDGLQNHSSRSLVITALDLGKKILGKKYPEGLEANDVVTGKVDPSLLRKYLVEMRKKIEDAELIRWLNEHEKVNLPNKNKLMKVDFSSGDTLAHTISRITDFDTKNMPTNANELIADVLRVAKEQLRIPHQCDPTKIRRMEENKSNLRNLLQEMKRLHEISELQRWVNKKLEPYGRKVQDVLDPREYNDGNKYCNLVHAIDPRVIERDVSLLDNKDRIYKSLNACKRDFKLLKELPHKDVELALVDRKDQFEFLSELKNYEKDHPYVEDRNQKEPPVDLELAMGPLEKVLDMVQPPHPIKLTPDPPKVYNPSIGGSLKPRGGDDGMLEIVTILQTERDRNPPFREQVAPQVSQHIPRPKDLDIWEMQLRELYYRKGRRTNYKTLSEEHEDNKFLEQRYRNFKQDLNEIYNQLNELLLSNKLGKPDEKLVKEYQNKLLKYKDQLKQAKGAWVKSENKLGSIYEPKTEIEVYFEKMRLKLLRVIDNHQKYTEDPKRLHSLQGKIAQLNKELYRDNELFESVKILRRNRRVARHNLEDLLEKKQKRLRLFFYEGEINRLYDLIKDLESGVNQKEKRKHRSDIIRFMIENFDSIFRKIPVSYKEISQLVSEPCKQIESRFKTKKDLYLKTEHKPSKVNQITTYSNNGFKLQLDNVNDAYLLAQVVKNYFNQLGNSILSPSFNEIDIKNPNAIKICRSLVSQLPTVRRSTASFIFAHFNLLSQHGNQSNMTPKVLSQIFSPLFLP